MGFYLQILRSDHGRSCPHRYPKRSSHPMDLRGETKAPRIARKDGCWKDVAWIGKRSSLFRHQRRIPPRRLAQKEHPLPHSLPSLSPFLRKQLNRKESANYDLSPYFLDNLLSCLRFQCHLIATALLFVDNCICFHEDKTIFKIQLCL